MDSSIVLVAQDLVDVLNAGSFSTAISATRYYRVNESLPDVPTSVRVVVVPVSGDIELNSRGTLRETVVVDVGVLKRLTSLENINIDPLMALVEEIKRYIIGVGTFAVGYQWLSVDNTPIYSVQQLGENKQFLSVLRFVFVGQTARP